jgi:hypothetical protein
MAKLWLIKFKWVVAVTVIVAAITVVDAGSRTSINLPRSKRTDDVVARNGGGEDVPLRDPRVANAFCALDCIKKVRKSEFIKGKKRGKIY